jgi:2-polyprenyl-3-methyl-5-hydroxy-6-metoxy-1,4-benzoquinol methylase
MLSLYQQDDYFSGMEQGYSDYAAQEPALRATFRRLLQTMAAHGKTGGDLLEIGCGYGYLLDEARPYFKRRIGTDFSARAVEQARSRADQVYRGGIEAIEEPEPFDCVIATHVIEHVYHPQDFISRLLERLRPGGGLLIATPDMGSYWRKLMRSRWPSFKLPEHVLYFDKWTQTRLLDQCGVQNIEVVPYPHAFPLPLIAAKLGLNLPSYCMQYSFWLPATTVACMGVKK